MKTIEFIKNHRILLTIITIIALVAILTTCIFTITINNGITEFDLSDTNRYTTNMMRDYENGIDILTKENVYKVAEYTDNTKNEYVFYETGASRRYDFLNFDQYYVNNDIADNIIYYNSIVQSGGTDNIKIEVFISTTYDINNAPIMFPKISFDAKQIDIIDRKRIPISDYAFTYEDTKIDTIDIIEIKETNIHNRNSDAWVIENPFKKSEYVGFFPNSNMNVFILVTVKDGVTAKSIHHKYFPTMPPENEDVNS